MQSGSVYVSATETSLHCFLLEKLGLFHDRHPQIRLKVTNVSTTQAIENVVSGRSDFAFVASPAEAPSPQTNGPSPFSGYFDRECELYRAGTRQLSVEGLEKISAHLAQPQRFLRVYLLSGGIREGRTGISSRYRIEYLRFDYTFYSPQFGRGVCSRRIGASRVEGGRNCKNQLERGNSGTYRLRGL